jgi:RNA polymerase sigma-70 factor, ECF subfamily
MSITTPQAPDGGRHLLDPESLADHVDRLYRAAYALCGSREEAQDLVQDAYERVLRRPRFVRRDHDLAYLLRVLRNTWIRKLQSKRPLAYVGGGEELDALAPAYDPIAQAIDSHAVFDALHELTLPLREAVVAVDVLGLSYRDAAQALGTKEGTIMSRVSRGRNQLIARLPD